MFYDDNTSEPDYEALWSMLDRGRAMDYDLWKVWMDIKNSETLVVKTVIRFTCEHLQDAIAGRDEYGQKLHIFEARRADGKFFQYALDQYK